MCDREMGFEAVASTFLFDDMLGEELDDDLEVDKDESNACAPTWHARCHVSDHGHRE